jgi:hypothetical protein
MTPRLAVAAARGDLLETHASLLGPQVSLCSADVGEASTAPQAAMVLRCR